MSYAVRNDRQGWRAVNGPDDCGSDEFFSADVPSPPPATADDHRSAIAVRRWKAETAGTNVNGMLLDTGRDSQALITGAAVSAMLNPEYSVRWKTAGGFVDMDAGQIIALATAVRAHVQACFDREAALLEAIDDGTYSDTMLEEGWPDGSLSAPIAG